MSAAPAVAGAVDEDRRLVILRCLDEQPRRRGNSSLLVMLLSQWGHEVSHDRIVSDLAWLAEQGLVGREEIGEIVIATLTRRGAETAAGVVVTPGVRRPSP